MRAANCSGDFRRGTKYAAIAPATQALEHPLDTWRLGSPAWYAPIQIENGESRPAASRASGPRRRGRVGPGWVEQQDRERRRLAARKLAAKPTSATSGARGRGREGRNTAARTSSSRRAPWPLRGQTER